MAEEAAQLAECVRNYQIKNPVRKLIKFLVKQINNPPTSVKHWLQITGSLKDDTYGNYGYPGKLTQQKYLALGIIPLMWV